MILFYDYKALYRNYKHNPKKFYEALRSFETSGQDFIVNSDLILKNPLGLQLREIMLYCELCSYRLYSEFKLHGYVDVPFYYLDEPQKFKPLIGKLITATDNKYILIKENT